MGVKGEPGASQEDSNGGATGVKAEATKHQITIKMGHSDEDISLKAKGTTRFEKIYAAVASARGIDPNSFQLTYDGDRINHNDTPASLNFEEEEQIDFHMTQIGGGLPSRS